MRKRISKEGWLYKVAYAGSPENLRPTKEVNLCDLFGRILRRIEGIILLILAVISIGIIGILGLVVLSFLGAMILLWIGYVILGALKWVITFQPNYLTTPAAQKTIFLVSVFGGTPLLLFIMWKLFDFLSAMKRKLKEPTQLLAEYIRAKKNKYCPIISIE